MQIGTRQTQLPLCPAESLANSPREWTLWVAPNATKHIWEETRGLTFGRAISQEQRLIGLAGAVDSATIGKWEQLQVSRGWELIFSEPRAAGVNPVLKHARHIGGSGL